MSNNLDNFLRTLGNPGRFQAVVLISMILAYCAMISTNFSMTFVADTPAHTCKLPEGWLKNESIPVFKNKKGIEMYERCQMYIDPSNQSTGLKKCDMGYEYDNERDVFTIATEYDFVCDDLHWIRIFQTAFFAGIVIGGLVGFICDRIGRKPVLITGVMAQALLAIIAYFSQNFIFSVAINFARGVFAQVILVVVPTLCMEIVTPERRATIGVAISYSGAFSLPLAAAFFQLFPHWRLYTVVLSSTTLFITVLSVCFVPESIRWLLSTNQVKRATEEGKRIAKLNHIEFPENGQAQLQKISEEILEDKHDTGIKAAYEVMSNRLLRNYFLVITFSSTFAQIASYGFAFTIKSLGGNMFINIYIICSIDILSRPLTYIPVTKLGRRISIFLSKVIIGVAALLSALFGYLGQTNHIYVYVAVACAVIGKMGIGLYWSSFTLLINELFPTFARSTVCGLVAAIGRLGPFILPAIMLLGDYYWEFLPLIVYGSGCVITGICTLYLPETKDRPMPDTIADATTKTKKQTLAESP